MRVEYSEDFPFVFSAGSPVFLFFFFPAIIKTDVFFPGKKSCLYQSILITFLFLIIGHFAYKMASIIPDSVIMNRRSRLQRENVEKKLKMIKKKKRNDHFCFLYKSKQ